MALMGPKDGFVSKGGHFRISQLYTKQHFLTEILILAFNLIHKK